MENILDQYELREVGEGDFVHLLIKQRRTKEISMLLNTPACEVVRRRKVILRKVRAIYQYHFKRDPIYYLQFAVNYLEPSKFRVLCYHLLELSPLKKIAKIFKCEPSTAQRWLQSSRRILEDIKTEDQNIIEYHQAFKDLPYLGIEKINRPKEESKVLRNIQVGPKTLGKWLEEEIG
jgi:hypothetical protein